MTAVFLGFWPVAWVWFSTHLENAKVVVVRLLIWGTTRKVGDEWNSLYASVSAAKIRLEEELTLCWLAVCRGLPPIGVPIAPKDYARVKRYGGRAGVCETRVLSTGSATLSFQRPWDIAAVSSMVTESSECFCQ